MVNILLLIICCICCAMTTIFKKQFQKKGRSVFYYNALSAIFVAVIFAVTVKDWSFNPSVFLYGTYFALSFASCNVFTLLALEKGSMAYTSLLSNFSLLIPTFYGIIFLSEKVGLTLIIGLILVVITLLLTGLPPKSDNKEQITKITPVWILFAMIAFCGNGMCSVSQRLGQEVTQNVSLMMVVALVEVFIFNIIGGLIKESKEDFKDAFVTGAAFAMGDGLATGFTNLIVTVLNSRMSASVMFPVIGALSLFISFIASIFFFKEKFTKVQLVGFAFSIASVVVLNL